MTLREDTPRHPRVPRPFKVWLSTALIFAGCHPPTGKVDPPKTCESVVHEAAVSGLSPRFTQADFWIQRSPEKKVSLMTREQITALNQRGAQSKLGFQDVLGQRVSAPDRIAQDLHERSEWLKGRVARGEYVESQGGALSIALKRIERSDPIDEYRVVHTDGRLACVPMRAALYTPPIDVNFDRNRCSELHPGEVLRVLRASVVQGTSDEERWLYVHAGHSVGWVLEQHLTPPLSKSAATQFLHPKERLVAVRDSATMRLGRSAPILAEDDTSWTILWPNEQGLVSTKVVKSARLQRGYPPMTRDRLLNAAFSLLNAPYGWGGHGGHRDCSRFILDVFSSFGLHLPRFSGYQAKAGSKTVSLEGLSESDKQSVIEDASRQGAVLLYMSGHIMLYLGEVEGRPWAISAISEYLRPCDARSSQTVRLDRTTVTDLELGRGTERTSFIERVRTLAVFGT